MGHSIFVTGTDTGVGKTFFTAGLIKTLREAGVDAVGFKPIECGGRSDAMELMLASEGDYQLDDINPYYLDQPLSPMAAVDSNEEIDLDKIKAAHKKLADKHELVIVEGAGGWLVPITETITMADLAAEMCDEAIIVAANKLGVLNHTLLTYRAIQEKNVDCARLVLNHLPAQYADEAMPLGVAVDMSLASNAKSLKRCLPEIELLSLRDLTSFSHIAKDFFAE